MAQFKVRIVFQDNGETVYRYAEDVGFTQMGTMEVVRPRGLEKGKAIIPILSPGMFVKYVEISDELIEQVPARIVTP